MSVSDASWQELERQIVDACVFPDSYIRLSFPLNERTDVAVQSDYSPPELVQRAGALGLGLEVSICPPDREKVDLDNEAGNVAEGFPK